MRSRFSVLSLAVLVIAGCSTAPEAGKSAAGPNAEAGAKTKLVFIPKSSGNPYFNQVAKGFEGIDGMEIDTQAPTSADATSQLAVIKDQVQRGVNVIVISANSPDALNEALDEATAEFTRPIETLWYVEG